MRSLSLAGDRGLLRGWLAGREVPWEVGHPAPIGANGGSWMGEEGLWAIGQPLPVGVGGPIGGEVSLGEGMQEVWGPIGAWIRLVDCRSVCHSIRSFQPFCRSVLGFYNIDNSKIALTALLSLFPHLFH